jgi:AcrR family transcriptional regulator
VLASTNMNTGIRGLRRSYRMGSRAAGAAETGRQILRATIELYSERFHDQVTLDDIAARAGVTVQTVLRRFRSKEELIEAAADESAREVMRQRDQVVAGDIADAVAVLLDHYEAWGRPVLRLLSQEERVPQLRRVTDRGRAIHAGWVRKAFEPFLQKAGDNDLLESQLIALTDVYMWKLLHLDLGLDRGATSVAWQGMIRAIVRDGGER